MAIERFLTDRGGKFGKAFNELITYSTSDNANGYSKRCDIKLDEDKLTIIDNGTLTTSSYKEFLYNHDKIKFTFNLDNGSLQIESTANSQGLHAKNVIAIIKFSAR